jgi:hypothetical protein
MIDSIKFGEAMAALGGAISFSSDHGDELNEDWYKSVVWTGDVSKPTLAELKAKMDELKADFDSKEYQRDRREQYPPIGDQLDALFHAGVFPYDMAATLQAVKDAYPKPE